MDIEGPLYNIGVKNQNTKMFNFKNVQEDNH
jgi:hypothetical protein